MSFRAHLKSGVAAMTIAAMIAPGGFAETPPALQRAPGSTLSVNVAQAADFSRIEFRFPGGAHVTSKRDGRKLILRFSKYAQPDMTRLRVDPPKFLKTAEDKNAGGLQLTLTLADGADAKIGEGDGAIWVNLFAKATGQPADAQAPPAAQPQQAADASRPNPVPDGGVVKVGVETKPDELVMHFPWKAPLGAAVFNRGDAIWIVFDAAARLDMSALGRGSPLISAMQPVQGEGFSGLRITAPAGVSAQAEAQGGLWTVTLVNGQIAAPSAIKAERDNSSATGALAVTMAGATHVLWIDDPVVRDRIAVVTALAPAKGLPSRREYVDMALLRSSQGLAVEPIADDLTITTDGDIVSIGRPTGLALSDKTGTQQVVDNGPGLPQPAARPGLIDFVNWPKTGSGGFMARYAALQEAAGLEEGQGHGAPMDARMGLARFLLGSQLSFEAIGLLDLNAKAQPNLLSNAEFRGLRGAAKAMAGRYKEAQTEFSVPILADDPASSLWRGYIDAKLNQWSDARAEFAKGAPALFDFAPEWRAKFARADAQAAIQLNQTPLAEAELRVALDASTTPEEDMSTRLVQAELFEAEGQKDRALGVYDAISNVNQPWLSAPALLHATQIRLAEGKVTPTQAADVLDGLRYRWRGDATELETIRALAQIYLSLGRYREALEALRSAGQNLPDLPEATELQNDLTTTFRNLFLAGQADGLQPVQALALFYDFKEQTPIGADGDLIVRKLARRLVDVDLLQQASDLLKYQEENRLDGVPRAQVATDLATIDLMNRQPEQALDALNESRTTILPSALTAQRRGVEARAWMMLGQYDHATEIIEGDKGGEAASVRAEIAWRQHNWASSAAQLESLLGDRWKNPAPLSTEEEGRLLRTAISLSLANDDAGLKRLHDHYQGFIDKSQSPDALRVALAGLNPGASGQDFAAAAAESDSFVGWVQAMKQKFRQESTPTAVAGGANRG